jgi:hypothetical protein
MNCALFGKWQDVLFDETLNYFWRQKQYKSHGLRFAARILQYHMSLVAELIQKLATGNLVAPNNSNQPSTLR